MSGLTRLANRALVVIVILFVDKSHQADQGCYVNGKTINYGETYIKQDVFKFVCKKTSSGWITKPQECKWKPKNGAEVWIKCNVPRTVSGQTAVCKCNGNYVTLDVDTTSPGCFVNEKTIKYGETYVAQGIYRFVCKKRSSGWVTMPQECKWKPKNGAEVWIKCNMPRTVNGQTAVCKCEGNYVILDTTSAGCFVNGKTIKYGETYVAQGRYRFVCEKRSRSWVTMPQECKWKPKNGAEVWIKCNMPRTVNGQTAVCKCKGNYVILDVTSAGCSVNGKTIKYGETYVAQGIYRFVCKKRSSGWVTMPQECKWKPKNGAEVWIKCNMPRTVNGQTAECKCNGNYIILDTTDTTSPGCSVNGKTIKYGKTYVAQGRFKFVCKQHGNGWVTKPQACKWEQPNGADVWVKCNIPRTINGEIGDCKCQGGHVTFHQTRVVNFNCCLSGTKTI